MKAIDLDVSALKVANLLKKYVNSKCESGLKWFDDIGEMPELHDLLFTITSLEAFARLTEEAIAAKNKTEAKEEVLEDLGLSAGTYNKLVRNGITDIKALCDCTVDDLLEMKRVGAAVINEITNALSAHGLALKEK